MGLEAGVSCSWGGADRPVSSGGSSTPSCNLTWGGKGVRGGEGSSLCGGGSPTQAWIQSAPLSSLSPGRPVAPDLLLGPINKSRIPPFFLPPIPPVAAQTFRKLVSLGQQEVDGVPMLINQLLALELSRKEGGENRGGAGRGEPGRRPRVACLTSATGMLTGCVSLRVMESGDTVKSARRHRVEGGFGVHRDEGRTDGRTGSHHSRWPRRPAQDHEETPSLARTVQASGTHSAVFISTSCFFSHVSPTLSCFFFWTRAP